MKPLLTILCLVLLSVHSYSQFVDELADQLGDQPEQADTADLPERVLPACSGDYSTFTWHNCSGRRVWADGKEYVGEFENGQPRGQGTFTWPNGTQYVGELRNGQYHGQGAYTDPNGNQYVGEFENDTFHGQGAFTSAKRNQYVGEFRDGEPNGQGTYTWSDGRKYVGGFQDTQRNGSGTHTLSDGSRYLGEYRGGKIHGYGNFYRTDGSIMGGRFEDDEFAEGYAGQSCSGDSALWSDCIGTFTQADGSELVGEVKDGKLQNLATTTSQY
jgi:hypothetical protein